MRKSLIQYQQTLKVLLAKYLNKTVEDVNELIKHKNEHSVSDWHKFGKDVFYEKTDTYLYDLIDYCNWDRLENILFPLTKNVNKTILDYGAGIGAVSFPLASNNKMYYYDVPSKTQEFAKYLSKNLNNELIFLEKEDIWTREYDGIICVDVLEHLDKPMNLVKQITKHLKPGQFFLTSGLDFSVGDKVPMHLIENVFYREEFRKYMDEHFNLIYFIHGAREIIYMFSKKEESK